MNRRPARLLFFVSAMLLLSVAVFFIRGIWVRDSFQIWWTIGGAGHYVWRGIDLSSDSNSLRLILIKTDVNLGSGDVEPGSWTCRHATEPSLGFQLIREDTTWWRRLGFLSGSRSLGSSDIRSVAVPSWFFMVLCATLSARSGRQIRRAARYRSRRAHGLCLTCAYDLRGAAHERCPECGETVAGAHPNAV